MCYNGQEAAANNSISMLSCPPLPPHPHHNVWVFFSRLWCNILYGSLSLLTSCVKQGYRNAQAKEGTETLQRRMWKLDTGCCFQQLPCASCNAQFCPKNTIEEVNHWCLLWVRTALCMRLMRTADNGCRQQRRLVRKRGGMEINVQHWYCRSCSWDLSLRWQWTSSLADDQ